METGRILRAGCLGLVVAGVVAAAAGAEAAKWSRAYINALPDEAFASVEVRPDGALARHLPHHRPDGRVDPAHLRNALARWNQVRWANPASAEEARRHLLDHYRELGLPAPGEGRGRPGAFRRPHGAAHPGGLSRNEPAGPRQIRIPLPPRRPPAPPGPPAR